MLIVAECESCHSRFRVKRTLLENAPAIRFRCRACGGYIVVRNPGMRKIDAAPSVVPPPEPVTPAVESNPVPPVPADHEAIHLEDLIPYSPEEEERIERDLRAGTNAMRRVARRSRSKKPQRSVWIMGMVAFFAGAGTLLFAIGAPKFRVSDPGSSNGATAFLKPAYDVRNLETYTPEKRIAGNLFVITGTVGNVGKGPSRGIRVQATLFGKDNQVLLRQASIAGNEIDKSILPHMKRAAIEKYLTAARYEEGSGNRNVPPGTSVPFMVVFFEPPEKVERFEVLATDAEP